MPDLVGDPSRGLTLRIRALESTDYAVPELWNTPFQVLLDNDAALQNRVDALASSMGGTTLSAHRVAAILDHPDGSVTAAKLADGSVTTPKLADEAVTGPKIAPGAVGPQHLAPGAQAYDLVAFSASLPPAGGTVFLFVPPAPMTLLGSGHVAYARVAPSANWSATILRNQNIIGSVTFLAGANTGSVSLPQTALAPGDRLRIVSDVLDTAMVDLVIALRGVI